MTLLHFEDFTIGRVFACGPYHVTREEIFEFAREFDPQPHHLDEEAAAKSMLKGLSASGWHVCAMAMRMLCDGVILKAKNLGGVGAPEARWMKPVRPGDTLHVEGEVVELIRSQTKPHGIVRIKWTAYNQHGEAVYTFNPIGVTPCRPA